MDRNSKENIKQANNRSETFLGKVNNFIHSKNKKELIENITKNKTNDIRKKVNLFVTGHKLLLKIILVFAILIGGVFNGFAYITGVLQSYGRSPHYYCDLNAPREEQETEVYKRYCKYGLSSAISDNSSIAKAAISLSTVDISGRGSERISWRTNGLSDVERYRGNKKYTPDTFLDKVPKLVSTANLMSGSTDRKGVATWKLPYYASCDLSVSLAVLWSGADDNFPMYLGGNEINTGGKYGIAGYLVNRASNKWQQVPKGSKILPGDIAMGNNRGGFQHIWMYVATWENGKWVDNSLVQEKYPGSRAVVYQGSHQDYYACVGEVSRDPWEASDVIYRYVGKTNENSKFRGIK